MSVDAEVAQLVEHCTENAGVPSSNLGLGTTFPDSNRLGTTASSRHLPNAYPLKYPLSSQARASNNRSIVSATASCIAGVTCP